MRHLSRHERLVEITKESGIRVRNKEITNSFLKQASTFTKLYSY